MEGSEFMTSRHTAVTLPDPRDRLLTVPGPSPRKSSQSIVLGASVIMLLSTTLVSLMNFGYNAVMARMLGPSRFGQVTVSVTLLMLASAVTLAFQLVCAKFVARNQTPGAQAGVYLSLLGKAWLVSLTLGGALFLTQKPIGDYLRMPDSRILAVLAVGIAAYVPLGVRRGAMQGLCSFGRLSASFIVEAVTRLACGVLLVSIGYGVFGAVGAISASVVAAFFFPRMDPRLHVKSESVYAAAFGEGIQAIGVFAGHGFISSIDHPLVQ